METIIEQQNNDTKLRPLRLRDTPFAWQDTRVMRLLRKHYVGEKRTTAIAIYQTLTNIASDEGRKQRKHINQFSAHLEAVADRSGKSISTIKRYAKEFRQLGILAWDRRKKGKMNLASQWRLLDYPTLANNPTSIHNSGHNPSGHNNDPATEEGVRKYLYNKGRLKYSRIDNGLQSIGDILGGIENS